MSVFHHVLGLWLAPDFSAVERGEMAPPHVDYSSLDTRDVARTLSEFNDCGEDVSSAFLMMRSTRSPFNSDWQDAWQEVPSAKTSRPNC
ncbi:hypothetical protein AWB82_07095 [Caballeronia glebae]|uniref:Uncharacterized protein n=1 Tax=Caballeronia glebae TaxID=1777143 RepID=A0A158DRN4_9BURK|nr:hypothetical protein AWB82_07095 [Caballeronia glebae]